MPVKTILENHMLTDAKILGMSEGRVTLVDKTTKLIHSVGGNKSQRDINSVLGKRDPDNYKVVIKHQPSPDKD
jgi:hypothetical protein